MPFTLCHVMLGNTNGMQMLGFSLFAITEVDIAAIVID
jgi:hypothetical protein